MANYVHTMTQINFNKSVDNIKGDEIIGEFTKIFGDVEIYNENCDTESLYGFNADFDCKWSAPLQVLTDFCNKYSVTIIGTSSDFDSGYVEAFKLPKNKDSKSRTCIIDEIERLAGDEFETKKDWQELAKLSKKKLSEKLSYINLMMISL